MGRGRGWLLDFGALVWGGVARRARATLEALGRERLVGLLGTIAHNLSQRSLTKIIWNGSIGVNFSSHFYVNVCDALYGKSVSVRSVRNR